MSLQDLRAAIDDRTLTAKQIVAFYTHEPTTANIVENVRVPDIATTGDEDVMSLEISQSCYACHNSDDMTHAVYRSFIFAPHLWPLIRYGDSSNATELSKNEDSNKDDEDDDDDDTDIFHDGDDVTGPMGVV